MSEHVRVRLVPKTREGESITMTLSEITPQLAKEFAPDPGRASEALRPALNLGMQAKITRHNSIEGDVPKDTFESVFGAKLVEQSMPTSEKASFSRSGTMLTTKEEISVPDDLRDTIAFAYIPNPVLFFAISPIPPNVSVYHLRLMDVLRSLNGSLCHRRGWTGRNIRVAMTDTGFANHPYFVSQGYNIQRVSTPATEHPMVDSVGHGTGESANVLVMAPDCHFVGVKHNDYSAEALETALDQDPHIITNSWGWDIDEQSKAQLQAQDPNLFNELRDLENIINDAIDDGVIVIFSAGNGHRAFPGSMPNVLAVGGVTVEQDGRLEASSYASSFRSQLFPGRRVPDVCGVVGEFSSSTPLKGHIMLPVPNGCELEGENMPISKRKKGWGIFSGTSAAAPQAAGVVALMLSANPNLTPNQVKSILSDTATDVTRGKTGLGDAARIGFDDATGAGFIDGFEACLRAEMLA
jgi:serine protease AprX